MRNDPGFIAAQSVEDAGDGLKLFTFPGGFRCYSHSSEGETSLIYTEIFVKQEYMGTHLSLVGWRMSMPTTTLSATRKALRSR